MGGPHVTLDYLRCMWRGSGDGGAVTQSAVLDCWCACVRCVHNPEFLILLLFSAHARHSATTTLTEADTTQDGWQRKWLCNSNSNNSSFENHKVSVICITVLMSAFSSQLYSLPFTFYHFRFSISCRGECLDNGDWANNNLAPSVSKTTVPYPRDMAEEKWTGIKGALKSNVYKELIIFCASTNQGIKFWMWKSQN